MNSPNPAYYEAMATARGVRPTPVRSWAILLTSANHGTVGPLGSTFPHAGEHHERVQVVEIVEAGARPAPGVDLAGLVRLPLTNEQIAAGAAIECDHGAPIGRNAAIDVFDAMYGAAPVAAQAGQVAEAEQDRQRALTAEPPATNPSLADLARLFADASESRKYVTLSAESCGKLFRAMTTPPEDVAGQVSVPGWISVDERYPEFTLQNRYLVASNWGVTVAHLHDPQWARNCFQDCVTKNDEGMTDFDGYQKGVFKVTHWMPLPPTPSLASLQPSEAGEQKGGA